MKRADVLIVEDDALLRRRLREALASAGIAASEAADLKSCAPLLRAPHCDIVLCDYRLPDGTALDLLRDLSKRVAGPDVFIMSAYGSIRRAVEAVQAGACDFFEKPLDLDAVAASLLGALSRRRQDALSGAAARSTASAAILHAEGSPMAEAVRLAEALAGKGCSVHIHGESGTGKELFARLLHEGGPRRAGAFVAVNCGAIAPQLIEGELFGHRKGAFTGALADRAGKLEEANGGTLFLDEVGDMPVHVQTRLLRVLQEKAVCRLGDNREIPVDFRLVSATHKDLRREVAEGAFREDLFYRLNVVEVRLPPLRERPMDIPLLLRSFLGERLSAAEAEEAFAEVPDSLWDREFPGNVRELRNLAERYCIMRELGRSWPSALEPPAPAPQVPRQNAGPAAHGEAGPAAHRKAGLGARDNAGPATHDNASPAPARAIRNSFLTDQEILRALEHCGYHRRRASELLGISRRALQYRLARMGGP